MMTIYWLVGATILSTLAAVPERDRGDADQKAKAAYQGLPFFASGDGMHMAPDLIRVFQPIPGAPAFLPPNFKERWGLVTGEKNWPVGLHKVEYRGPGFEMKVGVLGCAVCHSGMAAGRLIPGLGNKNIDVL